MTLMQVMEAAEPGGPEVLRLSSRQRPEPAPTEILVRVHAAGLNPVDWKTRGGGGVTRWLGPPPWVLGWDVSGVVERLGAGVTRFAVGDRVFGMPRFPRLAGGYGQYVTGPSRHFARVPDQLDHVHAAGLPLAGLTAWQSLAEVACLRPGQRVLIHAGGGGVGHLAVQLARHLRADVTCTATAGKHRWLRQLGAHHVVDYRTAPFEEQIDPVDVVLDLVGGSYATRSLTVLAPGGLLLEIPSGGHLPDDATLTAGGWRVVRPLVEPDGNGLQQLARLVEEGHLRVDIGATAPLTDLADLHRLGEAGHTSGKLVVTLG